MASRTITYTIYHPLTNLAWAGALVYARLLGEFTAGSTTYPAETYTSTADANGQGSIVLAVPDTGTARYEFSVAGVSRFTAYLAAGATTDLVVLLASPGSSISQSAIQSAIDAHAAVIATASLLGHIKVGMALGISSGVLSGIPTTIPFRIQHATSGGWAMPAGLTEWNGSTAGRIKADLTSATQARLILRMGATPGIAGAELRAQYSTDDTNWFYLDGAAGPACAVNVASTTVVSAWATLVAGAKADVFLRIIGINGDGGTAPTFGNFSMQVR